MCRASCGSSHRPRKCPPPQPRCRARAGDRHRLNEEGKGRHEPARAHAGDDRELRPRARLGPAGEHARAVGAVSSSFGQDQPVAWLSRHRLIEGSHRIRPEPRLGNTGNGGGVPVRLVEARSRLRCNRASARVRRRCHRRLVRAPREPLCMGGHPLARPRHGGFQSGHHHAATEERGQNDACDGHPSFTHHIEIYDSSGCKRGCRRECTVPSTTTLPRLRSLARSCANLHRKAGNPEREERR
jgi:hypothetical protein